MTTALEVGLQLMTCLGDEWEMFVVFTALIGIISVRYPVFKIEVSMKGQQKELLVYIIEPERSDVLSAMVLNAPVFGLQTGEWR